MIYAQIQISASCYLYAYFKDIDDIHVFIDTLETMLGEDTAVGITYTIMETPV